MNQEAIGHYQRALGEIFMAAMDRISRLKRRHRRSILGQESLTRLGRGNRYSGNSGS